jgi:hypothetical protein
MYVIIGSHVTPLEGKFLLKALVIVMITLNVSASNAPKCPLTIGVYIVQKIVVKLSNTSTMLFPPVAETLSNFLEQWNSLKKFI